MEHVTIYMRTPTGLNPLSAFSEVAKQFGLKPNDTVPEHKFWEVMRANAEYGIKVCQEERAKQERSE